MKALLNTENALLAVKMTNVAKNSTLPILGCVRIDAEGDRIVFTGTDLETTTRISVPALVEEEGAALFDFSKVRKVLESAKKNAVASFSDDTVTAGKASAKLLPWDLGDFPEYVEPADLSARAAFENAPEFMRQLGNALKHADKSHTRPILSSVSVDFEKGLARLVSTDSYRLYVGSLVGRCIEEGPVTVRREAAEIAMKAGKLLESAEIASYGNADLLALNLGNGIRCEVTSRPLEGKFPNWRQLIPNKYEHSCEIDRSQFDEGAKFIRKMTNDKATVTVDSKGGSLSCTMMDSGTYSYGVDCGLTDDVEKRRFNVSFLLDMLSTSKGGTVTIKSQESSLKPSVFENPEGDFTLIMPVRAA